MRYFAIKKQDGSIERLTTEESSERVRDMKLSHMELECMLGGVPSERNGEQYVIVDTDTPERTEDFFKD